MGNVSISLTLNKVNWDHHSAHKVTLTVLESQHSLNTLHCIRFTGNGRTDRHTVAAVTTNSGHLTRSQLHAPSCQ